MKCNFRKLGLTVAAILALAAQGSFGADSKETKSDSKETKSDAKNQQVTEGELSKWLVHVLGLARFVSVAPTEQECFAVLLQNGVTPKNGWNGTNVVSRATLARVVVQSLGQQSEVKDQDNDASWIDHLKKEGLDISTVGAAVDNLEILPSPLANVAVSVSTDPLGKVHKVRPEDEQQLGADLTTIRSLLVFIEENPPTPVPPPPVKHHKPPKHGHEVTPNFPDV